MADSCPYFWHPDGVEPPAAAMTNCHLPNLATHSSPTPPANLTSAQSWQPIAPLLNSLEDAGSEHGCQVGGGHAVVRVLALHLGEEEEEVLQETKVWEPVQEFTQV